jgi:ABC-type transport system involved in multi-copper enzyme maturation permease subunit
MQTIALFLDAYRELNAKRLFWFVLALSLIVVAAFAMLGINDEGITFLWWTMPFAFNTGVLSPDTFYKWVFSTLGIGFWLTKIATVLALVSTASLVPDLVSGGAIELLLSKPIGRVRLFLTKYVTGLLFVTLQVTVFCAACFLVIGIRGNAWEPGIFLAVPLVLIFFSYLFCVCALLGLITRSTITALLLTMLVWVLIFSLHSGESIVGLGRIAAKQKLQLIDNDIAFREDSLRHAEERVDEGDDDPQLAERIETRRVSLELRREERGGAETSFRTWSRMHMTVLGVKTALPKTTETIALLERWLVDLSDLPATDSSDSNEPPLTDALANINVGMMDESVMTEAVADLRERSPLWIIGTSLLFEAAVLALACFIFARRNF